MLIGLTGQIGAGKSTVAKLLKAHGAIIVDADTIGREVVDNSAGLLRQLVRTFGTEILRANRRLDRQRLAELAFASMRAQARLNKIVHPHLLRELHRQVRVAQKKSTMVVVDAALLFNWGLEKECDAVIVVSATRENRIARLRIRGLTRADVLARQRVQLPLKTLRKKADLIIPNNGTAEQLSKKIDRFWSTLHI